MSRTSIGTLLGLGCAVLVATLLEGALAGGVIGGYLFGAAIALLAAAWLRHVVRTAPERAMRALLEGFFMKFGGMVLAVVCVRYVPAAAQVADWRAFLVAYAAAALTILVLAALESSKALRAGSVAPSPLKETAH